MVIFKIFSIYLVKIKIRKLAFYLVISFAKCAISFILSLIFEI
jgi:hypothetical protein